MSYFRRVRDAALCVVLLALPFFVLRAGLREPSEMSALDRVLMQVSAPIQYAATQLALGVSGIIQDYVYLIEVKQDNDRLRQENALLRERVFELNAQAAENTRLRHLLELRDQLGGVHLSAQVIGKEVRSYFRVRRVRLDRGERDRVKPGMPVLTADGLVGQVERTAGRYAAPSSSSASCSRCCSGRGSGRRSCCSSLRPW
jgi:rod shape-determining protein MreC